MRRRGKAEAIGIQGAGAGGMLRRLFLLSPASTSGKRARILLSPGARFELALRVRSEGASIGDVFAFLSGLYFRGKLTYARHFAGPGSAIRVITSDRGLVPPELPLGHLDLRTMAKGDIDPDHPPYRLPLERDAAALARQLDPTAEVVLLGSIATGKYAEILHEAFGERLKFPELFVGRGDMSRGGLLLRAVRDNAELSYCCWKGAVVKGTRPPKLQPIRWSQS